MKFLCWGRMELDVFEHSSAVGYAKGPEQRDSAGTFTFEHSDSDLSDGCSRGVYFWIAPSCYCYYTLGWLCRFWKLVCMIYSQGYLPAFSCPSICQHVLHLSVLASACDEKIIVSPCPRCRSMECRTLWYWQRVCLCWSTRRSNLAKTLDW